MTRISAGYNSLVALDNLYRTQRGLDDSLTQLSTGRRINSGSDDPAGLIAAELLQQPITGLDAAMANNERADLLLNTADSALAQMSEPLREIRSLAVASANSGALAPGEIEANQMMIDAAVDAVDRIANSTSFAGRRLFDGSLAVQASPDGQTLSFPAVNSATLGQPESSVPGATGEQTLQSVRSGGANSLANGGAAAATAIADRAAAQVLTLRGCVGAFQKYGLEVTNSVLADERLNSIAARSEILDADVAQTMSQLTAKQTAMKSGIMALAIANRGTASFLDLLG